MILGVLCLATLIYALHGRVLQCGLFMDDHAHFRQLQECDWSFAGLTEACRLELVGGVVDLWWMPECTLRFFRPVSFGLMKLTYTLTGWSPTAMHLASLLWHLAVCTLLMVFLRRLGASVWLACAVAGLFAIHPGHLATVEWIACQTEIMVSAFLLGAALCFGRFRGWPGFGREDGRSPGVGWAIASAILFAAGLGCRENAVMFPFVMAAVEPLVWRQRRRPALILYAVFGVIVAGYLLLRHVTLGGMQVPPPPYVIRPTDPGFLRFVFDKVWYYLLGEYLLVPAIPIGGLPYFQARPFVLYGLAAGVVLLILAVWLRHKRTPAGLLSPVWLLAFLAPTLPVFASPHHLYLPGTGWAITVMLILRGIGTARPAASRLARWSRRCTMWVCIGLLGGVFGVVTFYSGLAFETGQRVENCLADEIASAPSGLRDGDTLYIANLPLIGHYARLAVEERTGLRGLRVIALTWAPRLLGPATPTELTWINDRTIEIRVADDRFFSGPLGRLARESAGHEIPDEADFSEKLGFRVRVLDRDAEGILALRFEFDRPLTDSRVHLFWGSRVRWAYEVRPGPHHEP